MLGRQLPKVETMLREAADDITAFADFPVLHWKKIWSTNPLVIWSPAGGVLDVRHEALRSQVGSVPGSGVSDGGVSVPDVRGPSRESLW